MILTSQAPHLPRLSAVAREAEALRGSIRRRVKNAVVYDNVSALNPSLGAHLTRDIYVERECSHEEIALVRLPSDATVLGTKEFILKVDSSLVFEQYPVFFPQTVEHVQAIVDATGTTEHITGEMLLLARYGIFTWGHWLGELLPKAVLAEALYPGRFSFVLPAQVVLDASPDLPWVRIRESLQAYGIDQTRITPLKQNQDYRFSSLYAISSVWSDHLIHPEVTELMRTSIRPPLNFTSGERMAISRLPAYGRNITNHAQIAALLLSRSFTIKLTGKLTFLDQVACFGRATMLFGTLGSDLTNLIYSPEGVKAITAAPAMFGDRFFYALIVDRNGKQIDLRGPVESADAVSHKSSFSLDPEELARAIALFEGD